MAAAYWGAVVEHLPKGDVVFDPFHVIQLINEKIDDLRRALQREADILGHKVPKARVTSRWPEPRTSRMTADKTRRRPCASTNGSPPPTTSRRTCASSGVSQAEP